MSHAINRHVLIKNKTMHFKTIQALLMTCFVPYNMQDSGQYSLDTEANASLQLQVSMKEVNKSYKDSDIVKMEGKTIQSEKFTESDFDF